MAHLFIAHRTFDDGRLISSSHIPSLSLCHAFAQVYFKQISLGVEIEFRFVNRIFSVHDVTVQVYNEVAFTQARILNLKASF